MNWANTGVWFLLMLIFLVVEASCPIHLISIWFAVGAMTAAITTLFGGPIWLQLLLFFLVSGALLAALWPITRKILNPGHTATNLDSVIGSEGCVTTAVDNLDAVGQVKLGGMYWAARSTNGNPIPQGTRIRVDRIEGVKVFVTAVQVEANV